MTLLLNSPAASQTGILLFWIVIRFAFMYFMVIRPQKKEEKKKNEMMNALEVGDTVLTTSGFYGSIIDIQDDTVIVEFGSNKNCRIPMQKSAIAYVEKLEDAYVDDKKKDNK
jgi:preprotein translocase subunit YajC